MISKILENHRPTPKPGIWPQKSKEIDELLKTPQAKSVLRRHRVTGTGVEAIRQGYSKKGDLFMYDLLKSVSPKTSVLHGNSGAEDEFGPMGPFLPGDPNSDLNSDGTERTKRTLEQWMSIFGQAGAIIGGIKQNVLGKVSDPSTPDPSTTPKQNNTLIWVVAAIFIVGLGIIGYQSFKS